MDIREHTCLVIRRGPEYLVGTILYSTDLRWSRNVWDAWLFNPVAGQIREARHEQRDEGRSFPDA